MSWVESVHARSQLFCLGIFCTHVHERKCVTAEIVLSTNDEGLFVCA
jgi:hypothetical protein